MRLAGFSCAALLLGAAALAQGAPDPHQPAAEPLFVGDAATPELPLAKDLSADFTRGDVAKALLKVGDWQLQYLHGRVSQDWTYGAMYAGYMAVPEAVAGKRYKEAMLAMARRFQWQLGARLTHADDHVVGQTYLELAEAFPGKADILPARTRMDALMQLPDDPHKPLWWWCDSLFMGPALLARLSARTGDPAYLNFMDRQWWITTRLLYNQKDHLYWRDSSFFDKHEANGANIYWARGNGWVFAGLARVLEAMPADYPTRPKYVALFKEMAQSIAARQGADGMWRAGLMDQAAYPLPESSGTAFFAYGFAWGIHHGLLDAKLYRPVVEKAWKGLLGHVYEDGRLGCVQPVGAAPGVFQPTSSYVYGTGAFLLAGSEIYQIAQ
jgi:rhamnogalacturonyl hydrolase YesR